MTLALKILTAPLVLLAAFLIYLGGLVAQNWPDRLL